MSNFDSIFKASDLCYGSSKIVRFFLLTYLDSWIVRMKNSICGEPCLAQTNVEKSVLYFKT